MKKSTVFNPLSTRPIMNSYEFLSWIHNKDIDWKWNGLNYFECLNKQDREKEYG